MQGTYIKSKAWQFKAEKLCYDSKSMQNYVRQIQGSCAGAEETQNCSIIKLRWGQISWIALILLVRGDVISSIL